MRCALRKQIAQDCDSLFCTTTKTAEQKTMKKIQRLLLLAAVGCITSGLGQLQAQDNNTNNNNGGRRQRFGGGNFDPAQFRQQMMDNLRERLEVKDDKEWSALEPLIQKVMDARRDTMSGMGRGMFGRGPRGGGDTGGDNGGGNRRGGFGGTPSPEADALEKAIEAKATNSELKAAIAKVQESRKAKQADLEKAQADLRKVLSTRQEAIATSSGLL
jgi:hypothetical protein